MWEAEQRLKSHLPLRRNKEREWKFREQVLSIGHCSRPLIISLRPERGVSCLYCIAHKNGTPEASGWSRCFTQSNFGAPGLPRHCSQTLAHTCFGRIVAPEEQFMNKSICQKQRFLLPFSPGLFEFCFFVNWVFYFLCVLCDQAPAALKQSWLGREGTTRTQLTVVILSWQEKKQVLLLREKLTPSFHISCVLMMPFLSWGIQED